MFARSTAILLVLVLVGPSAVAATCELTCAIGSHHHSAPASSEAPCHEHQGTNQASGIHANPAALCHQFGDLPSAIVDAWLTTVVVSLAPTAAVVVSPSMSTRTVARARQRNAPFDPRPAHRPLRV